MSNTLLTIDMITKEALRLAHEKATFIGTINRQFDESFGSTSDGKIGDTLRIRIPSQYTRRQGSRVMDVQDSVQQSTALVVATQDGVDMRFNSRELALDLDSFSALHIEPAMAGLISGIDSDVLVGCTKSTFNFAGTAGTAISTLVAPGAARTKLNQNLAPKGDRRFQVNSGVMGSMVNGVASYFNPSGAISEQYREGLVARTAMADYYENERTWSMLNMSSGSLSTGTLAGYISTLGQTSLITGTTISTTLMIGQKFTIAGVNQVHPETKQSYGVLQNFTVLTTTNASTISFAPAIYASGPRQNVTGVGTTSNTAALTFLGTHNSSYNLGLMYHRDAYTFATAALPLMADAASCVRRTYDGLSLRVWRASDIRNDEMLTRIDILYGFAVIRPQWGCAVIGAVD
jgi:hypothetical protein